MNPFDYKLTQSMSLVVYIGHGASLSPSSLGAARSLPTSSSSVPPAVFAAHKLLHLSLRASKTSCNPGAGVRAETKGSRPKGTAAGPREGRGTLFEQPAGLETDREDRIRRGGQSQDG